ncbi:hypothetical protein M2451_001044 [Dysgonomonas sp. PFB1-18]|uniref:hypothetical protein n=1 Tax=unclassified Dysgonomonas TaxID=2630389 RepID=UPI00247336F3|nr:MULTISPECIES: hypothetical protein [unclassified Dysgonomonas]MDH6308333.1 hypothetical protein [Dysgonomonas sp. PF1-14]MDH6338230.1 hypothetical protein [Dysgonomonas sp. PF1-16]MDH6379727.1 hypothetical protein [Dysgonomonas sp. PFB1-18]MDH6397184.1 hypothetical protein [Dysgonomonas sp. PF1-23]
MDIQQIHSFATKQANPGVPDISALKALVDEYPYFQTGIFTYLKAMYSLDNENFDCELRRLSIFVADRQALFYYILSEEYDRFFRQTGKTAIKEDKTSVLLNAFFESRGNNLAGTDEFEYSISHSSLATTDYFTYMQATLPTAGEEAQEQEGGHPQDELQLKHQDIIDTFITKSELEGGVRIQLDDSLEDQPEEENDTDGQGDELDEDIFFTETLAKIYIKQKKYEKAYKIIKHLSLNYPKKNIYFADQLSFLEKLIINSKFKDTK